MLWRVVIALDHVLYGVVVAGRLALEPAVDADRFAVRLLDAAGVE
ncbi:hypothetical protein [Streptomyces sp. TRM68367]|nr:hypothetical protein [Streptomyces sp. TRM68367]